MTGHQGGGLSKTVAFVVIGGLAGIGIVGAVVLTIHRPDASATFVAQLVTVLGLVVSAAGTLYGLGKITEKVEQVRHQTNGTLSTLRDELALVTAERDELRIAEAKRHGRRRQPGPYAAE